MAKTLLPLLLIASILSSCLAAITIQTFVYKQVGDLQIQLDVYTPPTIPASGKYPIFFCVHGGGDILGHKFMAFNEQERNEALNRHWVVVSIDYRLIPGASLNDIIQDVQDAYQWVHTELPKILPVDLNHITVFGKSAGGGLAVMSGYFLNPRPTAVVSFFPFCTNWTDPYSYKPETPVSAAIVAAANKLAVPVVAEYNMTGSTDPKQILWDAALASGKMGWLMVTHDPNLPTDQVIAQLRNLSATENIDEKFPPTYLAHGLNDTLVPYMQSVQMAFALKHKGVKFFLDLVPDANHDFDLNASNDTWNNHVLPAFEWAQEFMGNQRKIHFLSF